MDHRAYRTRQLYKKWNEGSTYIMLSHNKFLRSKDGNCTKIG